MDIQVAGESLDCNHPKAQRPPCQVGDAEAGECKHSDEHNHPGRNQVAYGNEQGCINTIGSYYCEQFPVEAVRPAKQLDSALF